MSGGVAGAGRRRASAKLAGAATLLAHDGEEEPGGDDAAVRPAGGPVGTGDAAPLVPSMPPAFIGLTAAKAFNGSVADYASRLGANWCFPKYRYVDAEMVASCHARGIRVMPWTANRENEWERLREVGCDGVITDYPAEAVQWRDELKIEN